MVIFELLLVLGVEDLVVLFGVGLSTDCSDAVLEEVADNDLQFLVVVLFLQLFLEPQPVEQLLQVLAVLLWSFILLLELEG